MTSKYKAIYQHYADQIDQKAIQPGASLPSEGKMMEEFGVSRDTVRKAMTLLEQNGYILKARGKESRVADRSWHDFPISKIKTFTELMEEEQADFSTIVEDLSILVADEDAMCRLGVDENEEVYRLIRARSIDRERILLDKDFLLRRYVPKLTREICSGSLYVYLEQELGLKIGVAKKIVRVQPVTREDRAYLDLHDDPVVAVVTSYTRLEDGTLFQYSESRHRIDKFQFVEYARR